MIFLQFGEAANASLIHLWNYLGFDEGCNVKNELLNRKMLIYSQKIGMKGIIQSEHSEESEHVINQKTGRWTDLNYATEFPESSYKELNQFDPTRNFLSSFYDSKSKSTFTEDFEEDSRKLAESCDWLDGFNFVSESCGSIGASTLHALEHLNDEYSKSSKVVLSFSERVKVSSVNSVNWENCDKFDGENVGKALKLALTFNSISDQHVTFIPITSLSLCPWRPLDLNLGDAREACRFFSSIEFDLFGNQSVLCKGSFASLFASTPNESTFNFTANQKIQSSLSKFRQAPIVLDSSNYQFENIDLVSYVDFNPKPFASSAVKFLEDINRPRLVWQQLESADVGGELAAGDYYQEILETLHQIKDLAELGDVI